MFNRTDNSNYIVYGLSAIKNVGFSAMEELVLEREENGKFLSLEDFLKRIPVSMNKVVQVQVASLK